MAVRTSINMSAPGGRSLTATSSRAATDVTDQEYAVKGGEFVKLVEVETTAGKTTTPQQGSVGDFKQFIAVNTGPQPIEIAIETVLIDDADDLIHDSEVVVFPIFYIPVGGFLTLPSPRIHTVTGSADTPTALNSYTNTSQQSATKIPSSTAAYQSKDGKIKRNNLSTSGITNGNGDLYLANLEAITGFEADDGIVPGTVKLAFIEPSYQEFDFVAAGLKPQTANDSSLLATNTAYTFDITMNGGSEVDLSITTDASNVKWGNPKSGTGVLKKIQDSLDAGEVQCDVALVNGNLRFTSRDRSEANSAVAVGVTGSGNNLRGSGIMDPSQQNAVDVGYESKDLSRMMFDDGDGNLTRGAGGSGTMTYGDCGGGSSEGGASIYLTGCPPNANVKLSYYYNSTVGGDLTKVTPSAGDADCNAALAIYARCINQSTSNFGLGGRNGKLRLMIADNYDYAELTE